MQVRLRASLTRFRLYSPRRHHTDRPDALSHHIQQFLRDGLGQDNNQTARGRRAALDGTQREMTPIHYKPCELLLLKPSGNRQRGLDFGSVQAKRPNLRSNPNDYFQARIADGVLMKFLDVEVLQPVQRLL